MAKPTKSVRTSGVPLGLSFGTGRPFRHVMHTAFDQMVIWVEGGAPPATAPSIEAAPSGSETVFARDARGSALGGIRLAAHAVPDKRA